MRMAACARQDRIAEEDWWEGTPAPGRGEPAPAESAKARSLKSAVADLEKRLIAEALDASRNNQQQAARALGLSRQGLINKLKRYSLQ